MACAPDRSLPWWRLCSGSRPKSWSTMGMIFPELMRCPAASTLSCRMRCSPPASPRARALLARSCMRLSRSSHTPPAATLGLVQIDGEVFAYQMPTPTDQACLRTLIGIVNWNQDAPHFARLVARGLLGSTMITHTLGQGPVLSDGRSHGARLPAIRLPLGPVLQLATSITYATPNTIGVGVANWFALSDQDVSVHGPPCRLNAPAALILCSPDGQDDGDDWSGRSVLPSKRGSEPSRSPCRLLHHGHLAAWALQHERQRRRLDGSGPRTGITSHHHRLVATVRERLSQRVAHTAQHLRSRTYAWAGFPVAAIGAYFDPDRMSRFFHGAPLSSSSVLMTCRGFSFSRVVKRGR